MRLDTPTAERFLQFFKDNGRFPTREELQVSTSTAKTKAQEIVIKYLWQEMYGTKED